MSESEGQRNDSPLLSERGVTTISDTVVSQVAGMAAQEVEGVHMGGGGTRTASGVLGSITGSESNTSGISVEVGRTETAIDLKMGIEYNRNILQTVEEVRQRITDRVESMTGLRIKELNATITDITFPEQEARRRIGPARPTGDRDDSPEAATDTAPEAQVVRQEETQAPPEDETSEPDERETAQVEATGSTPDQDSGAPEEEAGVEEGPPEEGETAEVPVDQATTEQPTEEEASETAETDETTEVSTETETSESETPEARMRRRAEERARRRRRRSEDS